MCADNMNITMLVVLHICVQITWISQCLSCYTRVQITWISQCSSCYTRVRITWISQCSSCYTRVRVTWISQCSSCYTRVQITWISQCSSCYTCQLTKQLKNFFKFWKKQVIKKLYVLFFLLGDFLNFMCRRFGTLCLFQLHRQCVPAYATYEDGTDRVIWNFGI